MRLLLTFALGLILGASLNEFAAKERHEGIYEGLMMTNRIMVEDYASFANLRAELCADYFAGHGIRGFQKAKGERGVRYAVCP